MKALFLVIAAVLLCCRGVRAAPPMLHVAGTQLKDKAGHVVRLQGVNIPSLEWTSGGDHVLQSLGAAMDDWHATLVRLPLSQDRWFGKAPEQNDQGLAYRALVDSVVQAAATRGKYLLLDLHWSDADQWGQHIGQHSMPDDNSAVFWKAVASRYANNSAVLFDLYNEPRDVTWDLWQHGGTVVEHSADPKQGADLTYHSPGMQSLLHTVRATGAKNIVIAGGLDWAYDLSGIVNGHALTDTHGNGVVYATHIYPWKTDWDKHVTPATRRYPVIVSEVGCEPLKPNAPDWQKVDCAVWAPQALDYIDTHKLSWTAWSFHTGASPCLISDWSYATTPYWGAYVKAALMNTIGKKQATLPIMPDTGKP